MILCLIIIHYLALVRETSADYQVVLPDPLTVFPFASNTGSYENLQIGSLDWNSQQCNSSQATTRSWTDGEVGSYNVADAAMHDFYKSFRARERPPFLPNTGYIPADYPDITDPCQDHVLSANCPSILSFEDAETKLREELKRHWAHLQGTHERDAKRRAQNRINKYASRWKKNFYLETAEDYHILAHEIHNERRGLRPQREGRRRRP